MPKRNKQPRSRNSLPTSGLADTQDTPNFGRRSSEDQERDKAVYKYLLHCLTDLGISEAEGKKPNESSIANQWGQKSNRIFIRRVLRSVLPEYYDEDEKSSVHTVPGLTLGKLVEILAAIQDDWAKKETPEAQVPRLLTRAEKLRAFRKFYQLSLEEKEKLHLPINSGEDLLQQLLETITDTVKGLKNEDIIEFYKGAINLYQSLKSAELNKKLKQQEVSDIDLIENQVKTLLEEPYRRLDGKLKTQKIEELVNKVQRELSRIEFQCGRRQVKSLLVNERLTTELQPDTNNFLSHFFIEHLTRSVVENEILTDEFSVYLKHLEIEKTQPLPLYLKTKEQKIGLLNPLILDEDEDEEDIQGIEMQFAYKVKVHFYIRIPNNYEPRFGGESQYISSFSNDNKLEFFEEITGIGSPISHIIAAINRVLLWDVPVLKDYLPVAHEILNNERVMGQSSHSPVWSYTLVKLCNKHEVEKAIKAGKNYDEVSDSQEPAYGEYCGFDLVEVATKAALHARLRAIKQTGLNPVKYLTELCHRVEELNALRKAKDYLRFYPFSLKAMEGYLKQTIFRDKYRTSNDQFNFSEKDSDRAWSLVAYDAHLTITEAYLKEGLYYIAKKYLDVVKSHIDKFKNDVFNDLMLAKYELCQFRYHYLTDLEDLERLHSERSLAVRAATDSLNSAEDYLKEHLRKYYTIGECSQSNFHPFFYLLSRTYAHRAKLYIFASSYTDRPGGRWNALIEPIRLLEKARIYAARDGSAARYAYWCAYQSWCYLMVAYLGGYYEQSQQGFSREECIDWAKRLIDHALICYSSTGKQCYQQIKDGGKITEVYREGNFYEKYGDTQIQVVPLIQELREETSELEQSYDRDKHVLNLDVSILKQIHTTDTDQKSIYLFGTYSSILLFALGMLELCEEEKSNNELQKRLEKAIRMFTYCSAIAEDGNKFEKTDDETVYLNRIFNKDDVNNGDDLVRGLYPHRLTQFADLGKIFVATCKSILTIYNSSYSWEDIARLLKGLHTSSTESVSKYVLEQKRYNGHLESHFERVIQYFEQLKGKKNDRTNLIEIRNKVVKDIFRIMRGDSDVKP